VFSQKVSDPTKYVFQEAKSKDVLTSPPVPFRVSFDPEDLRIEGNPFRVNPSP